MAYSIDIKHPGKLHRALGIPQGQQIPLSRLQSAAHSDSQEMRSMAQFALNARGFDHTGNSKKK